MHADIHFSLISHINECDNIDCLITKKNSKVPNIYSLENLKKLMKEYLVFESEKALKKKIDSDAILILIMFYLLQFKEGNLNKIYLAAVLMKKTKNEKIHFFLNFQKNYLTQKILFMQYNNEIQEDRKESLKGMTFFKVILFF